MAQPLPLAHRRLRLSQIFGRDALQCDQEVVVGAQFNVIAGCGRSIQDYASKVIAVRRTQIVDESFESFFNRRVYQLPPAPPPPKSPPPPKPPPKPPPPPQPPPLDRKSTRLN